MIEKIEKWIISIITLLIVTELVYSVYATQWLNSFLALFLLLITLSPVLLRNRMNIKVPTEFQLLFILFMFSSLFLGEIRGFYERFWWWDIALHTSSGFLLGILGFLLVYVLNNTDNIALKMKPGFVAFFAFLLGVAFGAIWEIFEFAMDQFFGMNMQKEMLGDPSGLTDTMWDLTVDAAGALFISLLGWFYMVRRKESFIDAWIHKFIKSNPGIFKRKARE
jgi:uncharacterized membrane protein YjdF